MQGCPHVGAGRAIMYRVVHFESTFKPHLFLRSFTLFQEVILRNLKLLQLDPYLLGESTGLSLDVDPTLREGKKIKILVCLQAWRQREVGKSAGEQPPLPPPPSHG